MTTVTMTDYQTILSKLTQISEKLDTFSVPSTKEAKKTRKPRDPDAPPAKENPWVAFTGRVGKLFEGTDYSRGKEKQQFCSFLKTTHQNAYEMSDKEILAARAKWTGPLAKPKQEEAVAPIEETSVPVAKPKRTLSEEQKAKMAAGRKAAAERKNAALLQNGVPVEQVVVPVTLEPVSKGSPAFRPFPFKGKRYLLDSNTNGLWKMESDGSQGDWVGVLNSDRKSIDTKAPNPDDADE